MSTELDTPPAWAVDLAKIALVRGSRAGMDAVLQSSEGRASMLTEGDFIAECGGASVKRHHADGAVEILGYSRAAVLGACCNDLQRAVIHFILAESSL